MYFTKRCLRNIAFFIADYYHLTFHKSIPVKYVKALLKMGT